MNIVLTGFMASGKTTVAKKLSEITGYEFVDTDDMIVEKESRSINEIFASDGEVYFRNVEKEVVKEASQLDNKIISTGGGVVLNKENIDELRKNGMVFNLSPEFGVIESRLSSASDTRPLLKNQELEAVRKRFNDRQPYYDNCDYKIAIELKDTVEEIAEKILNIAKKSS